MILIDYSPVLISCAHSAVLWQKEEDRAKAKGLTTYNEGGNTIGDVHMFRMLNTLRMVNSKYRREYGNPVICIDRKPYWRNIPFSNYKKNRKPMDRSMDWKLFFDNGEKIIEAARDIFGWKVIDVTGLEADDIIGILVHRFRDEKHMIVSPDGDFKQLHVYKNVSQYDTIRKKLVVEKDPVSWLRDKIIGGDKKDGIPNIVSDVNTFVTEDARQNSIKRRDREAWIKSDPIFWCTQEMLERYQFNEKMLDMSMIPDEQVNLVLEAYNVEPKRPGNLYGFFADLGITRFMDSLSDFT